MATPARVPVGRQERRPRARKPLAILAVLFSGPLLCLAAVASLRHGLRDAAGAPEPRRVRGDCFLQAAEWADKSQLNREDELPLIADATFDVGLHGGGVNLTQLTGRGSYIADFGMLDLPIVGDIRARAGLRYSRLYPRGALELGFRKELRMDPERGYELFVGLQTAGDDRRLDVVTDAGAMKRFRSAKAFYRFRTGFGWPFEGRHGGPGWGEMGSSLGVTQTDMPPGGKGELTVGWCTGLFDGGLEGASHPTKASAPKKFGLLDSTPYAAYGINVPINGTRSAHLSCTLLPEHNAIKHALSVKMAEDATGGSAAFSVVIDQAIEDPRRLRLRVGGSYLRGGRQG